jgi:hypothetical protein
MGMSVGHQKEMTMTHPYRPQHAVRPVRDLSDPTGSLVIYTGQDHHGQDIDVCRVGGVGAIHSPVGERRMGGRTVFCAMFPGLPVGEYDVLRPDRTVVATVTIARGSLVEIAV